MSSVLLTFASTFVVVFALGFQSQNVNQGRYLAAALTSLAIGGSSIALYKVMPEAGTWEMASYLLAGVTGITSSMWTHRRTIGRGVPVKSAAPRCSCGRNTGEACARLVCVRFDTDQH